MSAYRRHALAGHQGSLIQGLAPGQPRRLDAGHSRRGWNATAFGRPASSRGDSAFPQIRFVSLVENGTHMLFASRMAGCTISEIALAREVLPALRRRMLCLADRNFFGCEMWRCAQATGADLVWRIKKNLRLACDKRLPDGSSLSRIFPSGKVRRHGSNAITMRVVEYYLDGIPGAEPIYRLVTTILDHQKAPAEDLAALYHERWEIESAFDDLKIHLRGARIILRSKTPELVRQEFFALLMAHFAVRSLMHEAALKADLDPGRLSLLTPCWSCAAGCPSSSPFPPRRRAALHDAVLNEILAKRGPPRSGRRIKCGVKRKMSNFPLRRRSDKPSPPVEIQNAIRIRK